MSYSNMETKSKYSTMILTFVIDNNVSMGCHRPGKPSWLDIAKYSVSLILEHKYQSDPKNNDIFLLFTYDETSCKSSFEDSRQHFNYQLNSIVNSGTRPTSEIVTEVFSHLNTLRLQRNSDTFAMGRTVSRDDQNIIFWFSNGVGTRNSFGENKPIDLTTLNSCWNYYDHIYRWDQRLIYFHIGDKELSPYFEPLIKKTRGMSLSIRSVEEMKQCLFRILQKTINEINPLYNVLDNLWISVYLKDIKDPNPDPPESPTMLLIQREAFWKSHFPFPEPFQFSHQAINNYSRSSIPTIYYEAKNFSFDMRTHFVKYDRYWVENCHLTNELKGHKDSFKYLLFVKYESKNTVKKIPFGLIGLNPDATVAIISVFPFKFDLLFRQIEICENRIASQSHFDAASVFSSYTVDMPDYYKNYILKFADNHEYLHVAFNNINPNTGSPYPMVDNFVKETIPEYGGLVQEEYNRRKFSQCSTPKMDSFGRLLFQIPKSVLEIPRSDLMSTVMQTQQILFSPNQTNLNEIISSKSKNSVLTEKMVNFHQLQGKFDPLRNPFEDEEMVSRRKANQFGNAFKSVNSEGKEIEQIRQGSKQSSRASTPESSDLRSFRSKSSRQHPNPSPTFDIYKIPKFDHLLVSSRPGTPRLPSPPEPTSPPPLALPEFQQEKNQASEDKSNATDSDLGIKSSTIPTQDQTSKAEEPAKTSSPLPANIANQVKVQPSNIKPPLPTLTPTSIKLPTPRPKLPLSHSNPSMHKGALPGIQRSSSSSHLQSKQSSSLNKGSNVEETIKNITQIKELKNMLTTLVKSAKDSESHEKLRTILSTIPSHRAGNNAERKQILRNLNSFVSASKYPETSEHIKNLIDRM